MIYRRDLRRGAKKRFWDWVEELPPPTASSGRTITDQLPVHYNPMTDTKQTMARILNGQQNVIVSFVPRHPPNTIPPFHSIIFRQHPMLSINKQLGSPAPSPD
jgi:hypothetical protein